MRAYPGRDPGTSIGWSGDLAGEGCGDGQGLQNVGGRGGGGVCQARGAGEGYVCVDG